MDVIFDKPGVLTVSYNPEKNYIIFDWTSFAISLADIKEAHQKALDTAKVNKCYIYIAETSKVENILSQEIIVWFETWVPKLAEYGLKAIITVVPRSVLGTLSTRSWQREIAVGITMINVKSFDEVDEALTKI